MANQLVYEVLARDKASRTFDKIGDSAEKAGKQGSGFGKALKSGMGLAVGAVATAGLGSMFVGFIQDARESQKIGRLTTAVIKSTGGAANVTGKQVADLATSISNKTGADDEAVQSGANLLLTFTKVRNEVGAGNDIFNQATQASVDMAAALGTDTKGAALQLGKALNDPIKGVGALSRAGVSFTQQQKDQIRTLVESGRTLDAQKIILSEMQTQFGGAAAAAADPLQRLKVIAGNLGEDLGVKLLPVIDRGANFLMQFAGGLTGTTASADEARGMAVRLGEGVRMLGAGLQGLQRFVKSNQTALIALTATIGTLLVVTKAHTAFLAVQAAGGLLKYAASTRLVTALTKTWTAVQWLLNAALTANPIGIVIAAVAALGVGLVVAYKKSDSFRNMVDRTWQALRTAGTWVADFGGKVKTWVVDKFVSAYTLLRNFQRKLEDFELPGWVKTMGDILGKVGGGLRAGFNALTRGLGDGPGIGGSPHDQPRGVKAMMAALPRGTRLISGFRPGAITATGNPSYHGKGRAVDIPPSMALFNLIRERFGAVTKELIFSPAGGRQIHNGREHFYKGVTRQNHWDHVHWAMDRGGVARGKGFMPKLTSRPERVLSPDQTASFEQLVDVLDYTRGGRGRGGGDVHVHLSGTFYGASAPELARSLAPHMRDALVRMQRNGSSVPLIVGR